MTARRTLTLVVLAATSIGATTRPIDDPVEAIGRLRADLIDSYNRGDVDRLLSHLEPTVVATWQNGDVCRGPAEVRAYYNRMLVDPGHVASRVTVDPVVDGRQVYNGWSVSWGHLNDQYQLADGKTFRFDSRFTATLHHHDGAWHVVAFHASVNAFDNPVLGFAARKVGMIVGGIAAVGGLFVGTVGGFLLGRRRQRRVAA